MSDLALARPDEPHGSSVSSLSIPPYPVDSELPIANARLARAQSDLRNLHDEHLLLAKQISLSAARVEPLGPPRLEVQPCVAASPLGPWVDHEARGGRGKLAESEVAELMKRALHASIATEKTRAAAIARADAADLEAARKASLVDESSRISAVCSAARHPAVSADGAGWSEVAPGRRAASVGAAVRPVRASGPRWFPAGCCEQADSRAKPAPSQADKPAGACPPSGTAPVVADAGASAANAKLWHEFQRAAPNSGFVVL